MNENKSERLEVRLGYQEKSEFVDACETQGDTPSSALRRFIRGYVRRADADLFASAWRGSLQKRGPTIAFRAVGVLAAAAAVWGGIQFTANRSLSDNAIFSARDLNKDGVLQAAEQGLRSGATDGPNGVLKVLDLDASGTISRKEFVARGRMVFAVAPDDGVFPSGVSPRMTFVDFEFRKDGTRSDTFRNSIINAGELDRLVLWYADGTSATFDEDVEIQSDGTLKIMSDTATFPSSMTIETTEENTTVTRPEP